MIKLSFLIDEILLILYFDYKKGGIVRGCYSNIKAATSVFVFMVFSIFSSYKDAVHVSPACKIDA